MISLTLQLYNISIDFKLIIYTFCFTASVFLSFSKIYLWFTWKYFSSIEQLRKIIENWYIVIFLEVIMIGDNLIRIWLGYNEE